MCILLARSHSVKLRSGHVVGILDVLFWQQIRLCMLFPPHDYTMCDMKCA